MIDFEFEKNYPRISNKYLSCSLLGGASSGSLGFVLNSKFLRIRSFLTHCLSLENRSEEIQNTGCQVIV